MSRINDVTEKRNELFTQMQAFLDDTANHNDNGTMKAEAMAAYEKMETDMAAFDKELDMLSKQEARARKLAAPTTSAITGAPTKLDDETKTGRASAAYDKAFWNVMRHRSVPYEVMNELKEGQGENGGYLVPSEFETQLVVGLESENIFRKIAHTITTSSNDRKIPVVASHGKADWVEEGNKIEDYDEDFKQVTLGAHKLATAIKVSEELLADSIFSLDAYLAQEFARRIGAEEEAAFIAGDGKGKPTGIFTETGGAEVGIETTSETVISFDEVYDLFYALKAPYRNNAVWIMNDSTIKAIRKLKDQHGQYLWQPSAGGGTPDTLLNRPIYTSSYVPEIKAGQAPIAFGDFSYYWIADRQGRVFKRLMELYARNGQVGFIGSERVDGKLILPEAVKLLKMKAASEAA